jgi:hypothetical protein
VSIYLLRVGGEKFFEVSQDVAGVGEVWESEWLLIVEGVGEGMKLDMH